MGKCVACQHWRLKVKINGEYKPHGMAKYYMGFCKHDVEWRYFGGNRECKNGRFTPVEEAIFFKRLNWIDKRNYLK